MPAEAALAEAPADPQLGPPPLAARVVDPNFRRAIAQGRLKSFRCQCPRTRAAIVVVERRASGDLRREQRRRAGAATSDGWPTAWARRRRRRRLLPCTHVELERGLPQRARTSRPQSNAQNSLARPGAQRHAGRVVAVVRLARILGEARERQGTRRLREVPCSGVVEGGAGRHPTPKPHVPSKGRSRSRSSYVSTTTIYDRCA